MGRRIQTGCLVLAVLACWSVDSARAQVGMLVADKPAPAAEKHAPAAEHQEKPHVLHEAEAHAEHEEEEHSAFIVRGAYLLMQPRRRAMDFAIVSGTTNGRPIGNLVEAPWESTSGLRAGLAYRLPSDGWEIGVEYTYLFTDSTRSVTAPPGGTVYATLSQPATFSEVDSAAAGNQLLYNVLDVMVGRRFSVGESLGLWLGGGARVAWIRQDFSALYDGQSANLAFVSSPIEFDGYGLRVGGEGEWKLGEHLRLFAKAFGSLVVGDFDTSLLETNGQGVTTNVSLSDHYRKVVPVCELGLGLGWQAEAFRFRVGYELTNWIGLVDSPDLVYDAFSSKPSRRTSDLSIDGLSLEVQFTY